MHTLDPSLWRVYSFQTKYQKIEQSFYNMLKYFKGLIMADSTFDDLITNNIGKDETQKLIDSCGGLTLYIPTETEALKKMAGLTGISIESAEKLRNYAGGECIYIRSSLSNKANEVRDTALRLYRHGSNINDIARTLGRSSRRIRQILEANKG